MENVFDSVFKWKDVYTWGSSSTASSEGAGFPVALWDSVIKGFGSIFQHKFLICFFMSPLPFWVRPLSSSCTQQQEASSLLILHSVPDLRVWFVPPDAASFTDTHQHTAVNWCQHEQSTGLNQTHISATDKGLLRPDPTCWNLVSCFFFHHILLCQVQFSVLNSFICWSNSVSRWALKSIWFDYFIFFFRGEDLKPGKVMAGYWHEEVKI